MCFRSGPFPWFALNVKTHHEKAVGRALRGKGYDSFVPLYRSHHRSGGRLREAFLPLFPNYVFASFDPFQRLPVLTIPGVFSIVLVGGIPAAVPIGELEAIDQVTQSGLALEPSTFLEIGNAVSIEDGPLRGLEGRLMAFRGAWRLVISVELLQRSISVEIDRNWVRAACARRAGAMAA